MSTGARSHIPILVVDYLNVEVVQPQSSGMDKRDSGAMDEGLLCTEGKGTRSDLKDWGPP